MAGREEIRSDAPSTNGPEGVAQPLTLEAVLEELHRRLDDKGRRTGRESSFGEHLDMVPGIVCADGLKMSVQASAYHYCSPRESRGPWYEVKVGFPSRPVPEFADRAEDPGRPTETVYGYVPVEKVAAAILAAGGFAQATGADQ